MPRTGTGALGITRAITFEFGPAAMTANAVLPSLIEMPFAAAAITLALRRIDRVPVGRPESSEKGPEVVAFLVGPGAPYVDGQRIVVDTAAE